MRFPFCFATSFLSLLLFALPVLATDTGDVILGKWHGTSICVDKKTDTACKDEEVVYLFSRPETNDQTYRLDAWKIVNGNEVPMGDVELTWDEESATWNADFSGRILIRWTFSIRDGHLEGRCSEQPSGRLIRDVNADRQAE